METRTFDELTRTLGSAVTRRSALRGLAASAGALVAGGALLRGEDALAKNRRKNKNKNKNKNNNNNTPTTSPPANPAPVGAVVTCPNLGTACGLGTNTLVCNCRLTKEGTQVCANVVNPPNGATFQPCQQTVNCPAGQICDFGGNVCRTTCQTA